MLTDLHKEKLTAFAAALVDQRSARILVEPQQRSSGFWFGGGNTIRDRDGSILVCGRYRNFGDSRTGVGAGERGLELAIFRAASVDAPFEKIKSFTKADLACNGAAVVSIEGVALHLLPEGGIELFISTEKDVAYPDRLAGFQKPGTGVWSIDRIHADTVENLTPDNIEEIIPHHAGAPERLHCKDPVVTDLRNGDLALIYCVHPFTWSSSGTAVAVRKAGAPGNLFQPLTDDMLARGPVWDIAAARVTERLPVPRTGAFANLPPQSLYFYDSCECLRQLDENPSAVTRPRGWSCEEIGGIAVGVDDNFPEIRSLSVEAPLFVSPHGTGCSRYIATLALENGIFANWQQSQTDFCQPLVGHFLPMERVLEILA
ncbi:MAG: exo-alpha-sialidase [Verrucomicrobiae bacterium]|nr:exo-alpha-sialidase [Verrucomicrobiae bacterium]MCP5541920.1 exo-alpha-sialidase [Akkermansiaceae bacterium]MCP5551913.1 exo-alpha-sialidase [Akkermansiaceae bacterium]